MNISSPVRMRSLNSKTSVGIADQYLYKRLKTFVEGLVGKMSSTIKYKLFFQWYTTFLSNIFAELVIWSIC